jgi:integrase
MAGKRYFGNVRKLPSGRHQARYTGPDGKSYPAPVTFQTKGDAEAWLSLRQSEILRGAWLPPAAAAANPVQVREYAEAWIANRDLEQTTEDHYRQLLRDHIYPVLGDKAVASVTPSSVRDWHARLKTTTGPVARAHAYALLRTIMNTAVADEVIEANPCRVRGAAQVKRKSKTRPASLAELEIIAGRVPPRYKLMIMLAAWCALRFGELAELRRSDINLRAGTLDIRRGVVRTKGRRIVKDPKSEAGKREVHIPPHLMPMVRVHMRDHVVPARDALVFPASGSGVRHMAPATLYKVYYPAREAAARPDLRFHDLRHTGATLAAVTGATLKELMSRLGHSTPAAAMRYQHAAKDRDKVIADALSALATVTPIRKEETA